MIRAGIRRFFHLALRRRDRWEAEVEDEIKLHLALRAEQLVANGETPDHAYDEAVRRFGSLTESRARLLDAARHREQQMQRTEYLADLRMDLGFALRTLRRQKAWTAITVATLALGIGATTAVFSVVSTLLLHPIPYPDARRVVFVNQQPSQGNNTGLSVIITPGAPVVRAWMAGSRALEGIEGVDVRTRALKTVSGAPSRVNVASVFPTFTRFAGMQPMRGRMFTTGDIEAGGRVALVGESFWRARLGANDNALGQTLSLGDTLYTIVGVMPAGLTLGPLSNRPIDLWLPLDVRDKSAGMTVMARLRPGTSLETAARELDSLYARATGFTGKDIPFRAVVSTPGQRLRFHDSLVTLAAAVALVLLVACANVAHLVLARSTSRRRELAIRSALGAGRRRILRQLLAETLLLTLTSTALGVALGWLGLRTLISLRPTSLDALVNAHIDPTTLWLALAISITTALLFTIVGAASGSRRAGVPHYDSLKQGAPGGGSSRRRVVGRNALVVSEMALSATLLVGATLLIRSVVAMQHADLGFEPAGLYTVTVPLDGANFGSAEVRAEAMRQIVQRVRALPGVSSAVVARGEPGMRWFSVGRLEVEGEPVPPRGTSSFNEVSEVEPDYFKVLGIKLIAGRLFSDTSATNREVIVNAGFARKHWPGASALGQRVRVAEVDSEPWFTIVGVVNDAQTSGPGVESTAPMFYYPLTRIARDPRIMVRTTGGAAALTPIASILRSAGIQHPAPPQSVNDFLARSIAEPKFIMTLLSVFTGTALVLAAIGLYGMMAYTVAQRVREIGIRIALGASGRRIARSVVGRGAMLALTGAALGLFAAAWGTRVIETQPFGVTRLDPVSFIVGGVVLVGSALMACIVPTRRALAVDPMTAIRAD